MVNDEKYIKLLKAMISCVSNGDYSSVKELSHLELEKMEARDEKIKKEIKKAKRFTRFSKYKNKPLEEWKNKDLTRLMEVYSKYILNKIATTENLEELQNEAVSIHEFIQKM